jgi:hypothetical protein
MSELKGKWDRGVVFEGVPEKKPNRHYCFMGGWNIGEVWQTGNGWMAYSNFGGKLTIETSTIDAPYPTMVMAQAIVERYAYEVFKSLAEVYSPQEGAKTLLKTTAVGPSAPGLERTPEVDLSIFENMGRRDLALGATRDRLDELMVMTAGKLAEMKEATLFQAAKMMDASGEPDRNFWIITRMEVDDHSLLRLEVLWTSGDKYAADMYATAWGPFTARQVGEEVRKRVGHLKKTYGEACQASFAAASVHHGLLFQERRGPAKF